VPAALAPLNIVFMIDKSASMGAQDTNGDGDHDDTTEWDSRATRGDPVTAALIGFLENPGAEGLHATLGFFPVGDIPTAPDTGICSREQYENPAVPLQSLDDPAVELLVAQIEGITPSGGTPTLPALEGAIEVARRARAENPGSSSAVVMVTDGLPAIARVVDGAVYAEKCFCYGEPGCPDQDEIPYVAQAAQMGAADGIPTFVIGMGDVGFDPLHTIAAAGDTGQAYIVDADDPSMTQERLAAAFGSVRSVQAPCDLALPVAPEGEAFDRLLVNLELVSSGGLVQPIHYAGSLVTQLGGDQLTCPDPGPPAPADPWFWTYDDEDDPTRILLCASACGQIDGDAAGGIYVAYGCPTAVASAP